MCGSFHLRPAASPDNETSLDLRELVLDVPRGSAVLLSTKVSLAFKARVVLFLVLLPSFL